MNNSLSTSRQSRLVLVSSAASTVRKVISREHPVTRLEFFRTQSKPFYSAMNSIFEKNLKKKITVYQLTILDISVSRSSIGQLWCWEVDENARLSGHEEADTPEGREFDL